MSENLQKYAVSVEFQSAIDKIRKLKVASKSLNKVQENSLALQITLQKRLNALKSAGNKTGVNSGNVIAAASVVHVPYTKSVNTAKPKAISTEEKDWKAVEKALQKRLDKEEKRRLDIIDSSAKAEYKAGQDKEKADKAHIASVKAFEKARDKEIFKDRQNSIKALTKSTGVGKAKDTVFAAMLKEEDAAAKLNAKPKTITQQRADLAGPTINPALLKQRQKEAKAAKAQLAALKKARMEVEGTLFMRRSATSAAHQEAQETIRTSIAEAKTAAEVKKVYRYHKDNSTLLKKQNFLMSRMRSSSKQFAGNMISAFAIAAGAKSVVTIGQDFEAVNNTMLAVSASSEEAGENFKFVQGEAYRLGLGLKESAKGFAKMAAARGNMSLEDTKKAFTGISEMSTLLGLSADESGRAINALQQMMSKGVVSSEELKLQMGEVLPNAIPLMAKAAKDAGLSVSGTVKEMMDLQKAGKLVSSEVLPFFSKRLSDAAKANGGLEKAMLSNRVAMNRLTTSYQMAADKTFKGGFGEGLTEFFNATAALIKDNMDLWTSLGKIIGSAISGAAKIIKVLGVALRFFGVVLDSITDILGDFSGALAIAFSPMAWITIIPLMKTAFSAMATGTLTIGTLTTALTSLYVRLAPIAAGFAAIGLAIMAMEEVKELWAPSGKETAIDWKAWRKSGLDGFQPSVMDVLTGQRIKNGNDYAGYSFGSVNKPVVIDNKLNVQIDGEHLDAKIVHHVQNGISQSLDAN